MAASLKVMSARPDRVIGEVQGQVRHPEHAVARADDTLTRSAPFNVFIVLAAYNEGARIGQTVREVLAHYRHVVVVDDGSTDLTAREARAAGAVVLQHIVNRGQGAALQTGIEFSLRHGADCIVTFDGDGQHCVEDIAALTRPIEKGEVDVVLGSRFLGEADNLPWARRLMLKAGVLFTRAVSRVSVTDTHNGLRAFSNRAARRINITLDRMAHASELIDQVHRSGLAYREAPVRIRYTEYSLQKGQSGSAAIRILLDYLLKKVLP